MTGLKAIYFDFGGVFTDSPFELVERAGAEQGAAAGVFSQIIFGPYEHDGDHPWHRAERGELDLETARRQIIELGRAQGLDTDLYALFQRMVGNGGGLREALVRYVEQLRESDYRIGLITNNILEFRAHWRAMLPVDALFDVIVDSCEVGLRKPDPAIFEHALRQLGARPQEAIFLDDHIANVQAAAALGMATIHVTADEQRTIALLQARLAENACPD